MTPAKNGSSGYLMGVELGGVQTWEQLPTGDARQRGADLSGPLLGVRAADAVRGRREADLAAGLRPGRHRQGDAAAHRARPEAGLMLIAMISIYLGLFNLLPLPGLDGGRLMFLGWEAVSRRRVNERIEQTIHMVGVLVLLGLIRGHHVQERHPDLPLVPQVMRKRPGPAGRRARRRRRSCRAIPKSRSSPSPRSSSRRRASRACARTRSPSARASTRR